MNKMKKKKQQQQKTEHIIPYQFYFNLYLLTMVEINFKQHY